MVHSFKEGLMKKKIKKLVLSKETIGALVTGPLVAGGATQPGVCESRFCSVPCTGDCIPQSGRYPC